MKTITNWRVVYIDEYKNEGIGILLPGCTIKGVVTISGLQADIQVETVDIDISNLIITDTKGEQYLLKDTSRDYLQDIQKCIQIGLKEKEQEKEDNVR